MTRSDRQNDGRRYKVDVEIMPGTHNQEDQAPRGQGPRWCCRGGAAAVVLPRCCCRPRWCCCGAAAVVLPRRCCRGGVAVVVRRDGARVSTRGSRLVTMGRSRRRRTENVEVSGRGTNGINTDGVTAYMKF